MRAGLPQHMGVGDIALAVGFDGPEFGLVQAGNEIGQAVVKERARGAGPIVVVDPPEFVPSERIVAIGRLGADAEQLKFVSDRGNERSAVGFAQIAVFRHLAGHILVIPSNGTVVFQTVRPVSLPRAATYCKFTPSKVRMRRFWKRMGEEDGPR